MITLPLLLLPKDKYTLLLGIFENRQLKQTMEYVDSQIIVSTLHVAKGLKWDYVICGEVERLVFSGYYTCKDCSNKFASSMNCLCSLPSLLSTAFRETALNELSVFYVGVIRAKKQVYISTSAKRLDYNGNAKVSIFSCNAGIKSVNYRSPKGNRLLKRSRMVHKTKAWKRVYVGLVMTPRVVASDPGSVVMS